MSKKNKKPQSPEIKSVLPIEKEKLDPLYHNDHSKPITRRQLVSQGFMAGMGIALMPSLASMVAQVAHAQEMGNCNVGAADPNKWSFLFIDCNGGGTIPGFIKATQRDGSDLSRGGYAKQGVGGGANNPNNTVETMGGLRLYQNVGFTENFMRKASAEALAKTQGVLIAERSGNDTGNNPMNPTPAIAKAVGEWGLMPLSGTVNSRSGGRSNYPNSMAQYGFRPTRISNTEALGRLVDFDSIAGAFGDSNKDVAAAALKITEKQIEAKKRAIASIAGELNDVKCAAVDVHTLSETGGGGGLDVANNPLFNGGPQSVFSGQEMRNGEINRAVANLLLLLTGNCAAATVELRGFDYHTGNRRRGEERDSMLGTIIGGALEVAHRMQKNLVIVASTDGSASSNGRGDNGSGGLFQWTTDNSNTCGVFCAAIGAAQRPPLIIPRAQFGSYRSSGDVDTGSSTVANNTTNLAWSLVLNFMALQGKVGQFKQMFPEATLPGNLDNSLWFGTPT